MTSIIDVTKLDEQPQPADHERPLVLLSLLEDICLNSAHLLDFSEQSGPTDNPIFTVDRKSMRKLTDSFDVTDEVPKIDDNYIRPGWKTVIDRLEHIIETQIQPKHEHDHGITEGRLIDLMEGLGASDDVEDVMQIFRSAGISEPTIVKVITKLVGHQARQDTEMLEWVTAILVLNDDDLGDERRVKLTTCLMSGKLQGLDPREALRIAMKD